MSLQSKLKFCEKLILAVIFKTEQQCEPHDLAFPRTWVSNSFFRKQLSLIFAFCDLFYC